MTPKSAPVGNYPPLSILLKQPRRERRPILLALLEEMIIAIPSPAARFDAEG
jgi:hypothetical protein